MSTGKGPRGEGGANNIQPFRNPSPAQSSGMWEKEKAREKNLK